VIVDASVVTSALFESADAGEWAREVLGQGQVTAPHLMPAEVCQVLRRRTASGVISASEASAGLRDLLALRVELHPFEPFMERVWALRDTVTAYDAWYVALAEALDLPFATLDARLARAPGPRCGFVLPEE
jgi:predicted nucleic acid-binding protein